MSRYPSRKSSSTKKILMYALIGVAAVTVLLVVLEKTNTINLFGTEKAATQSGPTKEQQAQEAKSNAQDKQEFLDNETKTESNTPNTGSTSGNTQPRTATLSVSASQSSDSVTVLSQMHNVPSGTCKLTVANGSNSTSQTAQIIYQPEFSSCAGFNVPVSTLGTGTWFITLTATPTGSAALVKSTSLEVK